MTTSTKLSSLQGLSIFLIGMMGTGKSTLGEVLAQKLNYSFLDTDIIIEKLTKMSVSDIFASQGETGFRGLESQVLQEVCSYRKTVVATGGGIVLKKINWSYLKQGLIIWLDAPVDLLIQRLENDAEGTLPARTRPLLLTSDLKNTLTELLNQRRTLYAEADLHIEVKDACSPLELADYILEKIPTVLQTKEC
ncbi:MAG: Shikimate kinase 2 [Chroococcopsis gigantea SAG 12.99]|jgi:shikimate kinase|nr:shikimate kinase [Chlorogloea purpurea SAG 13.99]MDV3001822.1 Shikimate kinase 2 [Chroococcopsis gigantea SAG 12.99]